MRVHIKTLAGSVYSIDIAPEATVHELCQNLRNQNSDWTSKRLRLMMRPEGDQFIELDDASVPLQSCQVEDGAELILTIDDLPLLTEVLNFALELFKTC
jgi:hypothetical protein